MRKVLPGDGQPLFSPASLFLRHFAHTILVYSLLDPHFLLFWSLGTLKIPEGSLLHIGGFFFLSLAVRLRCLMCCSSLNMDESGLASTGRERKGLDEVLKRNWRKVVNPRCIYVLDGIYYSTPALYIHSFHIEELCPGVDTAPQRCVANRHRTSPS